MTKPSRRRQSKKTRWGVHAFVDGRLGRDDDDAAFDDYNKNEKPCRF